MFTIKLDKPYTVCSNPRKVFLDIRCSGYLFTIYSEEGKPLNVMARSLDENIKEGSLVKLSNFCFYQHQQKIEYFPLQCKYVIYIFADVEPYVG